MAILKKENEPKIDMVQIENRIDQAMEKVKMAYETHFDSSKVIHLNKERFIFCLGAVSSTRMINGIDQHMGFEKHYYCKDEAKKEMTRFHLRKMYGFDSEKSLLEAGNRMFTGGVDYKNFVTFWNNEPSFDKNKLPPEARAFFDQCKDFARLFYPYLKNNGMWAWDINERVGMLRAALACGIINEEKFDAFASELADMALDYFHDWEEYALSCLGGGAYFMFKQSGGELEHAIHFMEMNATIIEHIIQNDRVWLDAYWGFERPN